MSLDRVIEEALLKQEERQYPVLFLDLDGTVRKGFDEIGRFVNQASDVQVFPEVVPLLRKYKAAGYRIVGITNQGGIALGLLTMRDAVEALAETQRQCSGLFDQIYMCRHHPQASEPSMAHCLCRKPRIGMLVTAQDSLSAKFGGIYPPHLALLVGDRPEDEKCAENAGIKFKPAREWRQEAVGGAL